MTLSDQLTIRLKIMKTWADPRGRQGCHPLPWGPNSFIFMQFSAQKLQISPNLAVGAPLSGKS